MEPLLSIEEMKARGFDPTTLEAGRQAFERWARAEGLCEQIQAAFAGVKLGNGVGLLQGQGLDDYDDAATCAAYRAQDEKEDWSRLPTEKLQLCHSSLSFFDAEGMRFHLPAFLIADLREDSFDTVFALTHEVDDLGRYPLLNPAQRAAVRAYLLFAVEENDDPVARRALDSYWQKST